MDSVVHFEIPADDTKRAQKFYSEIFGWGMQEFPMGDMTYIVTRTTEVDDKQMPLKAGAINGGIFARPANAPNPVLYISVASIEDALKKVTAAGGKIITPMTPIPNMGSYARFTDTEGNVMALWQNVS